MKTKIKVKGFITNANELDFKYDDKEFIDVINEKIKDFGVHFDIDYCLLAQNHQPIFFISTTSLNGDYKFFKKLFCQESNRIYFYLIDKEFLKSVLLNSYKAWISLKLQIMNLLEELKYQYFDKEFILE